MTTVSIITPSYNSSSFISECVESVLAQTFENWELIIIDDCSVDCSLEIIEQFIQKDNRIQLITLKKNIGAAAARNIAIQKAKGRYIAFLDSDDVWKHDKLEKQLAFMRTNGFAFTFTAYQPMSEDGKKMHSVIFAPKIMTYKSYLRNTIIGCLTVIIDRQQTGDFQMPNIRSSHDMALWLDLMKRGFMAYGLNENLAKYRIVSSSNTARKWKAANEVWQVYRKLEKLSIMNSVLNFICYVFNAIKKRM